MGICIDNTRTDAYVGTFYKSDKEDMKQLETVRSIVSRINKDLRTSGFNYQFYVKCQGRGHRLGVHRYNQSLPLSFADKMDAYIYRR
jgi:hypothetical protein